MYSILTLLSDGFRHSIDEISQNTDMLPADVLAKCDQLIACGFGLDLSSSGVAWAVPRELLDPALLLSSIPEALGCRIGRLEVLAIADSTNDAIKSLGGAKEFDVCFAEAQLAGRGRRGNVWASGAAENLAFSYSFKLSAGQPFPQGLSLAVGVGVVDVLRGCGFGQAGIKWPNDIYMDDKKLGGILVEVSTLPGGGYRVIVGVGLNVNSSGEGGGGYHWTSLALGSGIQQARNRMASRLLVRLLQGVDVFLIDGLNGVREIWPAIDVTFGRPVSVLSGDAELCGLGGGIDAKGRFLLQTPEGVLLFDSADVSLRLA